MSYLSEFTSDLVNLPGSQNVVVDALSHPSSTASTYTVDVFQVSGLNPFVNLCLDLLHLAWFRLYLSLLCILCHPPHL